jgi:hypothetical protein
MMDTKAPHGKKTKLTSAERHKRFVETAKKVEASDKIEDFDTAFSNLTIQNEDSKSKYHKDEH